MTMVQREFMAGMEGEPIVFECFNSLDAIRKSFGSSNMLQVEARRLNEAVEQDLERIGLLSVLQEGVGKKDMGKMRRKKTGLVDEELSRQPSKGKIYGRKVNGRFASKAIYNYHHKKKIQGCTDEEKAEFIDDSQCSDDVYSKKIEKEDEKKDFVTLKNILSETKCKEEAVEGHQATITPNFLTSKHTSLPNSQAHNDQEKKKRAKKACEGGMVLLNEMSVERALKAFEHSTSDLPLPAVQKTKEKNFPLTSDDEIVSRMSEVKADDQTEYDADANLPVPPLPPALSQCPVLHCRLGCICDSLRVRPQNIKATHCGSHHCMLSCQCQHMTRARASKLAATDMFECPLSPRMKLNVTRGGENADVANSAVVQARKVVQSVVKKRTADVANMSTRNKKSDVALEISSESDADESHKRFKPNPTKESRRNSLQPTNQSCARTGEAYRKQNMPSKTPNNNNTNNQNKGSNQCRKPVMYLVRKKMNLNGKCTEKTLLIEAYSQCQWSNYKRRLSSVLFECVFVRNLLKSGPYVLRFEQFKLRVMKQDPGKNGVLNNININNFTIDNVNTAYIKVFIYLINNQPPPINQGSDPIIIPDSPTSTNSPCEVKEEGNYKDGESGEQNKKGGIKDEVKKEGDDEDEVGSGVETDGNIIKNDDGLMGNGSDVYVNGDDVGLVKDGEVKSTHVLEQNENKIQSNIFNELDKTTNEKHILKFPAKTTQKEASAPEIVNKSTHLKQDVKKEMKEAHTHHDVARKESGGYRVDEITTSTIVITSTTPITTSTTVPIASTTTTPKTTNLLSEDYLSGSESPECSFDDSDPPLVIDTSVKKDSANCNSFRHLGGVGDGLIKNSCKSSVFNLNASNKYKCQLSIYINEDESSPKKSSPQGTNGCPLTVATSCGASSAPREFIPLYNPPPNKSEVPIDLSKNFKHVKKTIVISKTPLPQLNSIPLKPTITISNTSPTKSIVNFPKPPISKAIISLPFTSISPPKPLISFSKTNSSINNVVNVSPKTLVSINKPIIHLSKSVISTNTTSNIPKALSLNATSLCKPTTPCNTITTSPVALKPNQTNKNIVSVKVLNITVSTENEALKKSIQTKLSPNTSTSLTKLSPNTSPTIIVKLPSALDSKTSPPQQPTSSLVMQKTSTVKDGDVANNDIIISTSEKMEDKDRGNIYNNDDSKQQVT